MGKEVLVKRDMAARIKTNYVTVPDIPVVVTFTADEKFLSMASSGKESFRLQQLVDAANDYLDSAEKDIVATVNKVERGIDAMWEEEAYASVAEANNVLRTTIKAIETGASKAVDAEWSKMQRQFKMLSDFKKVVLVNATFSAMTVAASLAATFATHGSLTLVFIAACKSACDTGTQLVRAFEDLDAVGNRVAETMASLEDTVERDLNRFADMAKGAAGVISPALRNFMASTKRADIELQTFVDKLDDADKKTDVMAQKVNDALAKAAKLDPNKVSDAEKKALAAAEAAIDDMLKEIQEQRKYLDAARNVAKAYRKSLDDYAERNPKYGKVVKFTRGGKIATAAVATATDVILKAVHVIA